MRGFHVLFVVLFAAWLGRPFNCIAEEPVTPIPHRQYKRIHQDWLQGIAGGKAASVEVQIKKSLAEHPDPESRYMLAVALSKQGKTAQALAEIEAAIAAGLPPSRFFAGRQQGLDQLAQADGFKKLHERHRAESFQGPLLGRMTDRSASVWLRLGEGELAKVIVRSDDDQQLISTNFIPADPQRDDVVEIELPDLSPSTEYHYQVIRKRRDNIEWSSAEESFRTFPKQAEPGKFTIAFGGGAGYVPPKERVWQTIDNFRPAALLLLGDNVYIDNPQLDAMNWYCYYRRQARPEFRQLVGRVPVYTIWDDHDFSTNDSHGGPEIDKPAWKRDVWNVFKNNWVNPGYGGGEKQPGCWYRFAIADVEFFMLDGRYYRTSPKLPAKQRDMLGPVQEKWLLEGLKSSKATVKVICSPVPWTYEAKGDSLDTWNGYQVQRTRIFDSLTKNKIEGVVLMSADRHRSDLWKIKRPDDYPLYEFNSSKLTNQHTHKEMKQAEFSYNGNSFGLVHFDTSGDDPMVSYEIIDIDGKSKFKFDLPLSKLRSAE